jgi:hypothetical protein
MKMKLETNIFRFKLDGKWYRAYKEIGDDGYTYFIDVETKEVLHSFLTKG